MTDINSGLTILGTAIGSKELVTKILGPTADYFGKSLKEFTEKRINNVANILNKASNKLGNEVEKEGAVPPRILKEVIDTGSFVEDEIGAEYYGGVLASSRSTVNRDDRAITYLDLIKKLSNYQIRLHYLLYSGIRALYLDSEIEISKEANLFRTYFPMSFYIDGMDFTSGEDVDIILNHSVVGLNNCGLISEYSFGSVDFLKPRVSESLRSLLREPGIICTPTPLGAELFLWAMGHSNIQVNHYIKSNIDINNIKGITLTNTPRKAS